MINELTSPESKLMLQYLKDTFNPTAIEPLVVQGTLDDLAVYDANVLYFGLTVGLSRVNAPTATRLAYFFYNELDAAAFKVYNDQPFYDGVSSNILYEVKYTEVKNVLFSRIENASYINFIGYKITIP